MEQHWRTEKTGGLVRFFVGDAALTSEDKVVGERWCADQMRVVSRSAALNDGGHQVLALEHKLVATRGSFLDVYSAMVLLDPNAAAPSGNGENKGPAVAKFMLNELTEIERCIDGNGSVNEFKLTEVLRGHGRLEFMPENATARAKRAGEMLQAMKVFAAACSNPTSTVRDAIAPILTANLFEEDSRLIEAHADKSAPPPEPGRGQQESVQDRMRRDWCALFASPWPQLHKYRANLAGGSVLATHQVVKGSEFSDVMVVMDDVSAGGFLFSYDKIFGGKELSDSDRENAANGKETSIDRTLRLLCVTCSRAKETLALVLRSSDATAALARIREMRLVRFQRNSRNTRSTLHSWENEINGQSIPLAIRRLNRLSVPLRSPPDSAP